MKRCRVCKVEKELKEFNKDKSRKDGFQGMCKLCLKQYYHLNKEKITQCHKQYRQLNKEKIKQYYQINREEIKEYQKQYQKQYYRRNPEKNKARQKLNRAVRSGKVHKPVFCSSCDSDKHLEAHHTDYTKPFDVLWLCRSCHRELHSKIREQSRI